MQIRPIIPGLVTNYEIVLLGSKLPVCLENWFDTLLKQSRLAWIPTLYGDWPLQVHRHGICLLWGFNGDTVYRDGYLIR